MIGGWRRWSGTAFLARQRRSFTTMQLVSKLPRIVSSYSVAKMTQIMKWMGHLVKNFAAGAGWDVLKSALLAMRQSQSEKINV
mmetsp:Transcript_1709/g.2340  ORF Transcript_1709/g.2340 Transcript_1709/m.2340 type:complete len:83 (+) Transcript_1709:1996-2244(+)